MLLEHLEVNSFRGIFDLKLNFTDRTVLFGENAWGKSSLVKVLLSILGNNSELYEFTESDFRRVLKDSDEEKFLSKNEHEQKWREINNVESVIFFKFTFRERVFGSADTLEHLKKFSHVWCKNKNLYQRLHYYIKGIKV